MLNKLFESKSLHIDYNKEKNLLMLTWNGFLNSKEFRDAASQVIKAIKETKAQSILSDNRSWKIISPNDYGWASHNWFPEAEANGVHKLATILSNDYFNRISERSIENMAEVRCMEIRNFQTREEAELWLSKSKTPECAEEF